MQRLLPPIIIGALSVSLLCSPAFCGDGTVGVPFLEQGTGARASGMGGAYSAVADGGDALFWNPAGLGKNSAVDVVLNHQLLLDTLNYDVGSVAFPLGTSRVGLGYSQLKSNPIEAQDELGNSAGSFEAKDQLFLAGYGHSFEKWGWGVSGKYIHSNIAGSAATAWATDIGVNMANSFSDKISHAFVLQNIGTKLAYDGSSNSFSLPAVAKIGTAYRPIERVTLGLDLFVPKGGSLQAAVGSELRVPLQSQMSVALRAGYETGQNDPGGMSGLGLGGGLTFAGLGFDYAWVPHNVLGSDQIFTMTYRFANHNTTAAPPINAQTPPTAPMSLEIKNDSAPTPSIVAPPPVTP